MRPLFTMLSVKTKTAREVRDAKKEEYMAIKNAEKTMVDHFMDLVEDLDNPERFRRYICEDLPRVYKPVEPLAVFLDYRTGQLTLWPEFGQTFYLTHVNHNQMRSVLSVKDKQAKLASRIKRQAKVIVTNLMSGDTNTWTRDSYNRDSIPDCPEFKGFVMKESISKERAREIYKSRRANQLNVSEIEAFLGAEVVEQAQEELVNELLEEVKLGDTYALSALIRMGSGKMALDEYLRSTSELSASGSVISRLINLVDIGLVRSAGVVPDMDLLKAAGDKVVGITTGSYTAHLVAEKLKALGDTSIRLDIGDGYINSTFVRG